MVLQALNQYYEILASDPENTISPVGYSVTGVSFAINLSAQGELLYIYPLFERVQRGKKTVEVPLRMKVPEPVKRSVNVAANFLWDNSAYVLGLSNKNENDPQFAQKRFEAFRNKNIKLLKKADSPAASAVISFLNLYDPNTALENEAIAGHIQELLKGGFLVFRMDGNWVHEDPEIRRVWEMERYKAPTNQEIGLCLVTGEKAPIARLHPSLKGIKDANSTGATLVGFNASAYESYGKVQGDNSPVSEKAAFAYTTALNYLLSSENENRKFHIGDTTVVYWAESSDRIYATVFAALFGISTDSSEATEANDKTANVTRDKRAERLLAAIAEKVRQGDAIDLARLDQDISINEDTRFYVLGLAPNAARISIRFFFTDPFLKMVQKIMAHYNDMAIEKEFADQPSQIPLWKILDETISKKASDKTGSPLMAGAVFTSILNNTPYPAALYYAIINRVKADAEDPEKGIRKINYYRAAIIKAYLTRKYRHLNSSQIKEVLSMSLNEQSTNPAYLLGRLFAVLEKVQKEAIGDVNASIKDRYFTSACASPATVFPQLLRLSQYYISKAEYGYASDNRIEAIMNLLDVNEQPIPSHLSLDEQGVFILGYYHQRAAFYIPKSDDIKKVNKTEEVN